MRAHVYTIHTQVSQERDASGRTGFPFSDSRERESRLLTLETHTCAYVCVGTCILYINTPRESERESKEPRAIRDTLLASRRAASMMISSFDFLPEVFFRIVIAANVRLILLVFVLPACQALFFFYSFGRRNRMCILFFFFFPSFQDRLCFIYTRIFVGLFYFSSHRSLTFVGLQCVIKKKNASSAEV